jgi:preflagellin peptidase FlaK
MVFGVASVPDLLRLLLVPVFAWAAYRDVRTRRLPNRLWPPLALVGLVALAWDAVVRYPFVGADDRLFLVRVGFAVLFLLPFSYVAYLMRAFGGADAKAMMVLALAFPAVPAYALPSALIDVLPPSVLTALPRLSLPLYPSLLGVTAMATLTNAVLVALVYVLALAFRNLLAGRVSPAMFVGRPTRVADLPERYGSLLETGGTLPTTGLDLDALRMYLRWRGITLADLRADPARFRDPASVGETFDPTDGAVHRESESEGEAARSEPSPSADGDGWEGTGFVSSQTRRADDEGAVVEGETADGADTEGDYGTAASHDPWAAEAFLDDLDGSAYGTSPERLREGLAAVTREEVVWVSPGLPFVVPLFGGLVVALTLGDALTLLLRAVGVF